MLLPTQRPTIPGAGTRNSLFHPSLGRRSRQEKLRSPSTDALYAAAMQGAVAVVGVVTAPQSLLFRQKTLYCASRACLCFVSSLSCFGGDGGEGRVSIVCCARENVQQLCV
ncbi:hypothetical protein GQ54DRAFT_196086 [Martensiomyces pterosporus]|nr:hypothetical protein GQ54DRAFT_196086 [Martensiomyces pterosporus]